jgi:CHAT domain-containing protein
LPGSKPNTFLLEERALAIIPVPQMLPELLSHDKVTTSPPQASMLLVGDVDFAAASRKETAPDDGELSGSLRAARDSESWLQFAPLPGTGREIKAIADLHARQPTTNIASFVDLRGTQATEAALRSQAPHCRWLHLATHGYFAPDRFRSTHQKEPKPGDSLLRRFAAHQDISGFLPGLLSGVVLAGANRPPESGHDDGILTALEVEQLDLSNVELAVLSACETGLGKTAGGEGVLGLQRAFQIAGARTTVTSLWKVDDAATQTLMAEFYNNLWQKKLGKLEALRQAQLTMLRRYDPTQSRLRGLQEVAEDRAPAPRSAYYWAAFILSGDWR